MQQKSELSAKVRMVVYGTVHGVNYRRWLKRVALARGLHGWVRNRSDGTVEAVLAGPANKVGSTLLQCSDGPIAATVESVFAEPYKKDLDLGFRIRPRKQLPAVPNNTVLTYLKDTARKIRRRWKAYLKRRSLFQTYRLWLKQNSNSNFKQFYVENILRYLDGRERAHRTLGPHPRKRGDTMLRELIGLGLKPSDVVVDYGCGTLREGVYLLRYLDAGNYIGLDIDSRILQAGCRLCGETLLAKKKPILSLISPESISRVAAAKPRWVVSSEVLQHVPPQNLDEYLTNLAALVNERSQAIVYAPFAKRTVRYSPTVWYHGRNDFIRKLDRRGLTAVRSGQRKLNRKVMKVQMIVSPKSLPRTAPQAESLAR